MESFDTEKQDLLAFLEVVVPGVSGSLQLLSSEGASRTEVGLGWSRLLFRHLFTPSLSRFLVELSNDTDAPEVVLCNAISYQLFWGQEVWNAVI